MLKFTKSIKNKIFVVKKEVQRLRYQQHLNLKSFAKPKSQRIPLILLCTFRSGSNLLISHLKCLPEIHCIGTDSEVLRSNEFANYYTMKKSNSSTAAALNHIRRVVNASPSHYASIKLVFSQLNNYRITPKHLLDHFPNAKFIILYRRSLINQYVSQLKVNQKNCFSWKNGKNRTGDLQVIVDPKEFIQYSEWVKSNYRTYIESPAMKGKFLLLNYETFAQNSQHIISNKITPFLSMQSQTTTTTLKKQAILPISETILNYSEIKSLLSSDTAIQDYSMQEKNDPC